MLITTVLMILICPHHRKHRPAPFVLPAFCYACSVNTTGNKMMDKILKESEHLPYTDSELKVLKRASNILLKRLRDHDAFTSPSLVRRFAQYKLAHSENEIFAVMFLCQRNTLLAYEEMWTGNSVSCSAYPALIVKQALKYNSPQLILLHQHPSNISSSPSETDKLLTNKVSEACKLFDIAIVDHVIVTNKCSTSFKETGLL